LADDRQILEPEVPLRVGAQHGPHQLPFLEVAKMVVAQPRVHRPDVARGVVLLLQRAGWLQSGEPAELVFADDTDPVGSLLVQALGAPEFLAAIVGC